MSKRTRREFVETEIFTESLKEYKDKELERHIKDEILKNPKVGDVVSGTGGLRKFRLRDSGRNKGKRGGLRIMYLDLPTYEVTYLVMLYGKDEKDDLDKEEKDAIKVFAQRIKDGHKRKK